MHRNRQLVVLVILLSAVAVALLTWLQPYTLVDDMLYHFKWRTSMEAPFEDINSLGDIVTSQQVHYGSVNGRILLHTIAQGFLASHNKWLFDVCNGVVFGALLCLIVFYFRRKVSPLLTLSMTTVALWVLLPGFADVLLWVMGAFNYLWAATLIMAFLVVFSRKLDAERSPKDYLWAVSALIAGWTHEGLSLPLAVGIMMWMGIYRQRYRRSAAWPYVGWFALGAALCAFAPATLLRAGDSGGFTLMGPVIKLLMTLVCLAEMRVLWVLAVVVLCLGRRRRKLLVSEFRDHGYLHIALLLTLGVVYLSGRTQSRVCFGTEFYAMLALIPLVASWVGKRAQKRLTQALMLVAGLSLLPAGYYGWQNHQAYLVTQCQLDEPQTKIVGTRQVTGCGYLLQKYVFPYAAYGCNSIYFAPDSQDENMRAAARWYGHDSLAFVPEDLLQHIHAGKVGSQAVPDVTHQLFVMRCDGPVQGVRFMLGKDNPPIYKRFTMYQGDTFDAPRWKVLKIDGQRYVFFDVPLPKIARRIREVRLL